MPLFRPPGISVGNAFTAAALNQAYNDLASSVNGIEPDIQIEPGQVDNDKLTNPRSASHVRVQDFTRAELRVPAGGRLLGATAEGLAPLGGAVTILVDGVNVGTLAFAVGYSQQNFAVAAIIRRDSIITWSFVAGTIGDLSLVFRFRHVRD